MAVDCITFPTVKGPRIVRVSVVNFYGNIVLDTLVKPYSQLDYDSLASKTGIRPADFELAPTYPKIASLVSPDPNKVTSVVA